MLGGRVAVHLLVHGGRRQQAKVARQMVETRSFAIPPPRGRLNRPWRGEDNQVCPFSELNMAHRGFGGRIEQAVGYRVS
jgi:hypothetical protein